MLFYTYSTMPNHVTVSPRNVALINNQIHDLVIKFQNHHINQNKVNRYIAIFINHVASIYYLKRKMFLKDNFTKSGNYYVLKKHNPDLKSSDSNHMWAWTASNFSAVAKRVFDDLKYIHNFTDKHIRKASYVTVISNNTVSNSHVQSKSKSKPKPKVRTKTKIISNTDNSKYDANNFRGIVKVKANKYKLQMSKINYKINNSVYKPFKYYIDYRSQLRPLWNPFHNRYYLFTANVNYISLASIHWGLPTVVLTNIKHNGRCVSSHCHIFGTDVVSSLIDQNIKKGSVIKFYAQVCRYAKRVREHYYLDFSLQSLKDVHLANYSYPYVPSDKATLIKLIDKCIPASQLKVIMANYLNHIQNNVHNLKIEIAPIQSKLTHLTNLRNMLENQQNEVSKSMATQIPIIKADSKNIIDEYLRLVALLWCKQFSPVLANQYHLRFARISGLSRRLTGYAQRCNISYRISKDNNYAKTYYLVKSIYAKYRDSIQTASHLRNDPHCKLTISQIGKRCHLPLNAVQATRIPKHN